MLTQGKTPSFADIVEWSLIFLKALIYGLYLKVMSLLVLITGKAGASNLCENTSQEVMVLALVQRCTAKRLIYQEK